MPSFAQTWVQNLPATQPTMMYLDTSTSTTWLYVSEHGDVPAPGQTTAPANGGRVLRFNLTSGSATPQVVATRGTGPGQFISPDGITMNSAGFLFVADRFLNRVEELQIDPTTGVGTRINGFGVGAAGATEMRGPLGLARDSAGAIYVSEHGEGNPGTGGNMVSKWAFVSGAWVRQWRVAGSGFATPYGIAVSGTEVYVSDGFNNRVQTLSTVDGSTVRAPWSIGVIPLGLSLDGANLWVSEASANTGGTQQVSRRNATTGVADLTYGTAGTGNGQFALPFHAIRNAATNRLYVSDYNNNRVQVINLAATPPPATPSINSALTASVAAGAQFSYTITATNSPTTFTATGLPAGLTFSSPTISGTVATAGTYNITIGASNASGADTETLVLTVNPSTPPPTGGPSVSSFAFAGTTLNFNIQFSESVTGVDISDFEIQGTGATTATLGAAVTGTGASYSVPFTWNNAGPGSIYIRIKSTGTGITGASGAFAGAGTIETHVPVTSGAGDTTAPTVTSFTPGTATGGTVTFTLNFSESVWGLDASDITLAPGSAAGSTIGAITYADATGSSYRIPVTFTASSGTIALVVRGGAAGDITDGNDRVLAANATSSTFTIGGGGDVTAPTIASFTAPATATGGVASFTLTFSEAVTGVTVDDFTATVAGGATATVGTPTGSGATWTIPVTVGGTAGGTVTLTVAGGATANIRDAAANVFAGGAGSTSTAFTIPSSGGGDTIAPTVASFTAPTTATGGVATFTVTFTEPVTGVGQTDFTATVAGGATATVGVPAGSGASYTIPVTVGGTAGGTVTLTVAGGATANIRDIAGNLFAGGTGSTSTPYTIPTGTPTDTTAPTVASFTAPASATGGVANFTLTFSEAVTGVTVDDLTTALTGGATATVGTPTGSGTTWSIPVTVGGTAGGTVRLTVAGGTTANIRDAANNLFAGGTAAATSTAFTIPATTPPDTTAPTVASFTAPGSSTGGVANFVLTFSEAVTGVTAASFSPVLSGGATATIGTVSGSGAAYTIPVTVGGSVGGTVRLTVAGGATANIRDAAGNLFAGGTAAATSSALTITGPTPAVNNGTVFGQVGAPITAVTLSATNSPTAWTAPGLAAYGLTISSAGVISGTPTASATNVTVTVTASNANGSGTGSVILNINPAPSSGGGNNGGGGGIIIPPPIFGGGGGGLPPVVFKADQTISFSSPVSAIFVGEPASLGATASSGLPVSYTIVSGNATVAGNMITVHSAGEVVVRASQSGSTIFNAAAPVNVTITALKNNQTITMAALSDVAATNGPITLSATSSSGLPVTYTVSGPATVSGNTLRLNGTAGVVTVTASQNGDDAFNAATSVSRTFNVRGAGTMVFFGKLGSDDFAAAVNGSKGILVARLASSGQGVVAKFNVNANGSFSAQAVASIPVAEMSNGFFVSPAAAAGQTYTVNGTLNNGVLSGTIVELGQSFTANVESSVGATASMAGIYTAAIPGSASGETYIVVGPTGKAYAVAMLPSGTVSGTGTVSPSGAVNITASNGATIAGTIEGGKLAGAVTAGGAVSNLVGLNDSTTRTDRIINLSSRLRVVAGDASRSVIAGFVVTGTQPKQVLVRAVGPGLTGFGVAGALANPSLQLYSGSTLVAENNDWSNNSEVIAIGENVGAFRLGNSSADAAIVATLQPGAYTAVVQPNGGSGVALIEVYDASTNTALGEQLVNISTRGFVDTGDGQLIAGFVVSGNAPKRVLIRGIGPGLSQFGVPGAVSDPMLRIYGADGTTLVAQNDDWSSPMPINANQSPATSADVSTASTATGAFPLASNSKDAAIVITLMPGQYSAVVSGVSNGTGAGLVEVYEIPNL